MSEPVDITITRETVNDETVRIVAWRVEAGSRVEKGQLVCEAETSKAVMEIFAPATGILIRDAAVGDEVAIGIRIGRIAQGVAPPENQGRETQSFSATPASGAPQARLSAAARTLAAEHGIDVTAFRPGTLVRRDDLLRKAGVRAPATPAPFVSNVPTAGVDLEWSAVPRRKVAQNKVLTSGQHGALVSSVTVICRTPRLRERGARLGVLYVGLDALVVFEVARLLRRYSSFNGLYADDQMGVYREVNVGWAIDAGQELLVPVIAHADEKGLTQIAREMEAHFEAYVSGSLTAAALARCTFTVSNLAGHSVSVFNPLISQGQSAVLGIGSEVTRLEGESLYLTLVFDHRVAEGRTAALLLNELRERLEAHSAMIEDERVEEPFCMICQRSGSALSQLRAILLKAESPPGLICSLCIMGLV